jgi:hypothetical protein
MKTIVKSLIFISFTCLTNAEEHSATVVALPLKPLIEAMEKNGLAGLNTYLDEDGKWPRITTDSFAVKNKIANHSELVVLSDRLVSLLRERSEAETSTKIEVLESEAKLFFSLSEKFWKADGYRNRVKSLLCSELASYRCGKIVILSGGEKIGPPRPEILKVHNSGDMLNLFVALIPENEELAISGLKEALVNKPATGETWLEVIVALRETEIAGTTVGKKFDKSVRLGINLLGAIINTENISSLVLHYGWSQLRHEAVLPALAMYLKNGGSLQMLMKEPANATKFDEIMKNKIYQFSTKPVMSGRIDGGLLGVFVEDIQIPKGTTKRLFGTKK